MVVSELIEKLQEIQKEHGDVEALAVFDTYGTASGLHLKIAE